MRVLTEVIARVLLLMLVAIVADNVLILVCKLADVAALAFVSANTDTELILVSKFADVAALALVSANTDTELILVLTESRTCNRARHLCSFSIHPQAGSRSPPAIGGSWPCSSR